jgi:chondroitin AC lyase
MRQGSWENVTLDSEYTTAKVSLPIYSLAINHGVHPENARYAYAVSPLSTPEGSIWYKVLTLSDTVHAVLSSDETTGFCVFFAPGSVDIMGHNISVEEPCMLMLRGGKRYIADPTRREYQLHVTIDGERKEIRIPTWQYAGTTVEF